MTDTAANNRPRAILPALEKIYLPLDTFAETLLRVVAGLLLVTHGYGKILNPFGAAGMVEGLGSIRAFSGRPCFRRPSSSAAYSLPSAS